MQQIIDGKLYDTKKSTHLGTIKENDHKIDIYKSKKGTFFTMKICANCGLELAKEEQIKEFLRRENVQKYIDLFGEVDEG